MSYKRNWKGVKWRDTAFAKPFRRMAVRKMAAAMVCAQAYSAIMAIRSSRADPKDKAAAIANVTVANHQRVADIMANGFEGMTK